jgi:hypothetical protein
MALVTTVLGDHLRRRVQSDPGGRSVFASGGSLPSTEARLAALEAERAEAMARIEAESATPVDASDVDAT